MGQDGGVGKVVPARVLGRDGPDLTTRRTDLMTRTDRVVNNGPETTRPGDDTARRRHGLRGEWNGSVSRPRH
jgi:hypothetical protein